MIPSGDCLRNGHVIQDHGGHVRAEQLAPIPGSLGRRGLRICLRVGNLAWGGVKLARRGGRSGLSAELVGPPRSPF